MKGEITLPFHLALVATSNCGRKPRYYKATIPWVKACAGAAVTPIRTITKLTAGKDRHLFKINMKVHFVDKVRQDDKTENPQLIDGKIYHWIVRSECMKIDETMQQWIHRKTEERNLIIEKDDIHREAYQKIEGIVIYDFTPILSSSYDKVAMIIRYDYLQKNNDIYKKIKNDN